MFRLSCKLTVSFVFFARLSLERLSEIGEKPKCKEVNGQKRLDASARTSPLRRPYLERAVEEWTSTTVAPGMTAPDWSEIMPVIFELACANAPAHINDSKTGKRTHL